MWYRRSAFLGMLWLLGVALSACTGAPGSQAERGAATPASPLYPQEQQAGRAGALPGQPGATPTAATPAPAPSGLVVAANEQGQSLTVVDASSNQVTHTIELGVPAGGVAIDPDGQTAWVFSNRPRESEIHFADLVEGGRTGTKRLRDGPRAVAFLPETNRAFVALYDGSSVSFLDTRRREELGVIELGRQTPGVELRRRPVSLVVINTDVGQTLYVAGQGSGAIWALDAGSGELRAEIEVGGGPTRVLRDPSGRRVYALVDTLNQVVAVDTSQQRLTGRLDLPGEPGDAAISRQGLIAVTGQDAGEVWLIEPSSRGIASRIPVGAQPRGVAFDPDGGRLYVANSGDATLSVVDVPTRQVLATLPVGQQPAAVAFATPRDRTSTPTPTPTSAATPSPTPTLVPSPTPLPRNARPPEQLPAGAVKEVFVPEAQFPVALAFDPDGRLFYAERLTGKIRIVENGVLQPEPFYDFTVAGQPETGLLGLTLDPNFGQNGYVYVFYTGAAGAGPGDGGPNGPNHVVRLTEANGKGADLTPIVPDLPSGQVHNGGSLRFGPNGKLYITLGETGNMSAAQDLSSPAGKVLRVNPDGSIPSDNPFAGQDGKHGAIWAYGFRNTFDLDFHPVTGLAIGGESGPGDNDELNLIQKGHNYGWPPSGFKDEPDQVDPIAVINPVVSPVGVEFYRGDQFLHWRNDFFYCNFHQGQLRRAHLAPGRFDRIVFEEVVANECTLDVTTGPDGALYYSDVSAIKRIRKAEAQALPAVATPEGASGSPTAAPATEGGLPQDRDLNVNLKEWKVEPSRSIAPAGKLRLLVENLGSTTHDLRIIGNGVDIKSNELKPGETQLLEVDLPPGTYELDCSIGNHRELGMLTPFTVEAP